MKTTLKTILLIALLASCRTAHKTQSEELKTSFTATATKYDSTKDIKVDGVYVRQIANKIKTKEITEYDTAGRKTRTTKETFDDSKIIDSGSVGVVEHSQIKDTKEDTKGEAVVSKLKTVERKVPIGRYIALTIGFALFSLLIGYVIKHRKNFAIIPI